MVSSIYAKCKGCPLRLGITLLGMLSCDNKLQQLAICLDIDCGKHGSATSY